MNCKSIVIVLITILLSSFAFAVTNDATLYYSFDDTNLSSSNPLDISGNGNHGTNNGALTGFAGVLNEQFYYDISDNILTSYTIPSTNTISLWFEFDDLDTGVNNHLFRTSDNGYNVFFEDVSNQLSVFDGTTEQNLAFTPTISTLYHLVFVRNGTSLYLYVNNVLNDTLAISSSSGTDLRIGGFNSVNGFGGYLDEFAVYSRDLTNSEISQLYNSGTGYNPYSVTNFTITAINNVTSESILNFTANVSGTIYSTTDGTIVTNIQDEELYNITLSSEGYDNLTYLNYNASTNLVAEMEKTTVSVVFKAFYYVSNESIQNFHLNSTFYNFTTTNGTINADIPQETLLFNISNIGGAYNLTNYEINVIDGSEYHILFEEARANISLWSLIEDISIQNFTVTVESLDYSYSDSFSTTSYDLLISNLSRGNYSFTIDPAGYEIKYQNETLTPGLNTYNYSFYTTNSVNISIYDQDTLELITGITTFVDFIGADASYNFTTSTGLIYQDLLAPNEYVVRATASGYDLAITSLNLNNRSSNALNIYMSNSSVAENVLVNVEDNFGDDVEGAVVKVLRYDVTTNQYNTVFISTTNTEGEIVFSGYLNTEYYKFIVEFPSGTIKKITNPAYLFSNTITIQIDIVGDVLEDYFNKNNVVGRIRYADPYFVFTYSDPSETVSQGCIKLYGLRTSDEILVGTNCTQGDSNTVTFYFDNSTYNSFRADAYVSYSDGDLYMGSAYYTPNDGVMPESYNLIYVVLLSIVLFTLFMGFAPEIAVATIPTPMLLFSFAKFIAIPWGFILPFQFLAIAGGVLIANKIKR